MQLLAVALTAHLPSRRPPCAGTHRQKHTTNKDTHANEDQGEYDENTCGGECYFIDDYSVVEFLILIGFRPAVLHYSSIESI